MPLHFASKRAPTARPFPAVVTSKPEGGETNALPVSEHMLTFISPALETKWWQHLLPATAVLPLALFLLNKPATDTVETALVLVTLGLTVALSLLFLGRSISDHKERLRWHLWDRIIEEFGIILCDVPEVRVQEGVYCRYHKEADLMTAPTGICSVSIERTEYPEVYVLRVEIINPDRRS